MVYAKALLFWLAFLVLAVALGTVREKLLRSRTGELRAHQVETLVLCAAIFALIVVFVRWAHPARGAAIAVGVAWAGLTLLFEFGVFHLWMGRPLDQLLADFNLRRGHLWPLVLLTELAGPAIAMALARAR